MNIDLDKVSQRTQGYWYVDGLPEIMSGGLFLLLSIPLFLRGQASQNSSLARLASDSKDLLLLAGLVVSFIVIRWVKDRSTYPRTGYVAYRASHRKEIIQRLGFAIVGILLFVSIMVGGFLLSPTFRIGLFNILAYLPTILALLLATVFITTARTGIKRFYLFAGVSVLLGIGLAVASTLSLARNPLDPALWSIDPTGPIPEQLRNVVQDLSLNIMTSAAILTAALGITILISGLVTRRNYLHQNPIPEDNV